VADQPSRLPTAEQLTSGAGPWSRHLGLVFDEVGEDRLVAHLDVDERHHQPYGIAHGGVWCSVVESLASVAGGVSAWADGKAVVGVSNTTDFLRPVRTGRVVCVAEPIHRGRLQHLWQVTITRADDGKSVARGQVRLQVTDADRTLAGRATLEDGAAAWGRTDAEGTA